MARLAAISAIAKGPGFLLPIVVAAFFGAGRATDQYFLAYAALLFVGGSIGQALEAAVVPYAATVLREGALHARERIGHFVRRASLGGAAGAVVGFLALTLGTSVSPSMRDSRVPTLLYYLLLAPAIVGWSASGIYSGALVAAMRLERSAIASAFRGLGALAGAVVAGIRGELYFLPIGLSLGELARAAWLRRQWRETSDGRNLQRADDARSVAPLEGFHRAATAQVAAQGLLAATPLVERLVAGAMFVAAISRLEYAYRLLMVCSVLFDGGIAPWLLARWSRQRSVGEFDARWSQVRRSLATAAVLSAAIAAMLALMAPLIIQVLLQHGRFTATDGAAVTSLIRWYSIGFVANMVALCGERALLATARNLKFLQFGIIRATARLAAVAALAGTLGMMTFPAAFALSEGLYLTVVLATLRRAPFTRRG